MWDKILEFLWRLLAFAIIIGLGALVSWIFYYIKRRDLFGGFIGGMVVGVVGALVGAFILDKLLLDITKRVLDFLTGGGKLDIDIIAGFLGAYLAVYVMNKLNHDKSRKKY